MVRRALRVCPTIGCPIPTAGGRCPACAAQYEQQRGSRQARGYDRRHDRLRRQWKPKVDAGTVHCHAAVCLEPTRWIIPGSAWDLGHTEDRSAWTGPEHMHCNRSAGGRAAHCE
jgi:hypothetical protein